MAELKHGPLTAEMVPLLTAGKSVLRGKISGAFYHPAEASGKSSRLNLSRIPDGFHLERVRVERLIYLGEDIGDGWIAAPPGGWTENPVPGQRVECRDPDGKEWLPRPSENWTDVNRWSVFTAFRLSTTPKHEAPDAMGMESQRDEGGQLKPCPFCGPTGEPVLKSENGKHSVVCEECGAWTDTFRTAASAEGAWNRRATPQPAEQSGEEIFGVTGAVDEVEALAVAYFARRCPGMMMSDEDLHYYRAAADAALKAADEALSGTAEQSASSPVEGEGVVIVPLKNAPYPPEFFEAINGYATGGSGRCLESIEAEGGSITTRSVAVSSEAFDRDLVMRILQRHLAGNPGQLSFENAADAILSLLNQARKPEGADDGVGLSASDRACYEYPGVDQAKERDAFVAGALAYAHPAHEAGEVERLRGIASRLRTAEIYDIGDARHDVGILLIDAANELDRVAGKARAALEDKS